MKFLHTIFKIPAAVFKLFYTICVSTIDSHRRNFFKCLNSARKTAAITLQKLFPNYSPSITMNVLAKKKLFTPVRKSKYFALNLNIFRHLNYLWKSWSVLKLHQRGVAWKLHKPLQLLKHSAYVVIEEKEAFHFLWCNKTGKSAQSNSLTASCRDRKASRKLEEKKIFLTFYRLLCIFSESNKFTFAFLLMQLANWRNSLLHSEIVLWGFAGVWGVFQKSGFEKWEILKN